ncbi:MAG: alpha/beta hydrolase [Alphaproteobacteria bacterium]|nr:MAG: alpha/beta hydrolase [Alphaproteobacteria bacterium]
MATVDFKLPPTFRPKSLEEWRAQASSARIAFAPFGGGPYFGYEVGVMDAMAELGIRPDVYLPGCIGNFMGLYHLMAVAEGKKPTHYVDEFASVALMQEKDYLKAPIAPFFVMRAAQWAKGFAAYYTSPEAWSNLFAPELFPAVLTATQTFAMDPTERNLGKMLRAIAVWHPMSRWFLGGYYFAPIGPFAELYDYKDPLGWIDPSPRWESIYQPDAPVFMMSLLPVGARDVRIATNCLQAEEIEATRSQDVHLRIRGLVAEEGTCLPFQPLDGRRLASGSNLPWLSAETEIDGVWYRESAVRDAATFAPEALEQLPNLELMIAVQIMDPRQGNVLTIDQGNHNNYATQITELVATIGDDDIDSAQQYFRDRKQDVSWIIIEASGNTQPFWSLENFEKCRAIGRASALPKLKAWLEQPKRNGDGPTPPAAAAKPVPLKPRRPAAE